LLLFGGVSQVSDSTDCGIITNLEYNTDTFTVRAASSEECDVAGLEDVVVLLVRPTKQLFGLTSEGSVVDLHLVGFEEDQVGGDLVTTLELNDIAWHKSSRLFLGEFAITFDLADLWDEVLEVFHEGGSLGRLRVGEDAGDEHDDGEHDTKVKVGLISLVLLDTVGDETEGCTEPEEQREEAGLLLQEKNVAGSLILLR